MAHEMGKLDTAFYGSNTPAWHGLGLVVAGQPTSKDALHLSGLDWQVDKEPAFFGDGSGFIQAPDCFFTVRMDLARNDPRRVLGQVGAKYNPIQNADCFSVMDALVDQAGMKFETAGSLFNGKVVYLLGVLPDHLQVKGDVTKKYLLATTSHDGTKALRILFTPVRVVCNNTLTLALSRLSRNNVAIRHTSNFKEAIEDAKIVLGLSNEYFDLQNITMQKLADIRVDKVFVDAYLKALIPQPKKDDGTDGNGKRAEKVRNRISTLFFGGQIGADGEAVKGTAYGLFNAVTEYIDHERSTKKTKRITNAAESRMNSVFFGSGSMMREKAGSLLMRQLGIGKAPAEETPMEAMVSAN